MTLKGAPSPRRVSRLEDFGTRGITTPEERLEEYKRQCRDLPKVRQARWWLEVLEHDPEVRELVAAEASRKRRRRAS